jgi:hypothetical protein
MSYTLDKIIEAVDSDKTHRSRLAKRIKRENYGVLTYKKREGRRSQLELTKPAYEYWVRKLNSSRPNECAGAGQVYCLVLENLRIFRNKLCNIVKVGRCKNFDSRKRRYTGPDAIKVIIGTRSVSNMQSEEKQLIRAFKENFPTVHNRNEYFLVPVNSVSNLRRLFHIAELDNGSGSSEDN